MGQKNSVGRNFSVGGVGGAVGQKNGVGQKIGVDQINRVVHKKQRGLKFWRK